MLPEEVRIGDIVRIREWDDMASEYPVDSVGAIVTPRHYFIKSMRRFCGMKYRVAYVEESDVWLDALENAYPTLSDDYGISSYMLERADVEPLSASEESEFISILMNMAGDSNAS